MPPSRSGIADYSAALLEPLVNSPRSPSYDAAPARFDPAEFDIALYQIGNNGYHAFAYENALQHPGVVVMHEANLHHLIADSPSAATTGTPTSARSNTTAAPRPRLRPTRPSASKSAPTTTASPCCAASSTPPAASSSTARFVAADLAPAGLHRPHRRHPPRRLDPRRRPPRIPPPPRPRRPDAAHRRLRLPQALQAHRRIAPSLPPPPPPPARREDDPRRRTASRLPAALHHRQPRHRANVRILGFTPIEDFVGYIAACDIILNLRYPTVGESSGTLLRALGLGKAVIVSNVGSFAEYPDDVCLKVPVGPGEEDTHLRVPQPPDQPPPARASNSAPAPEPGWSANATGTPSPTATSTSSKP